MSIGLNLLKPFSLGRALHGSPRLRGYLSALALLAIAFAISLALKPVLGNRHPYLLFIPAALGATWIGGFGPGLVVLVGSYLLADFFFATPLYTLGPFTPEALVSILVYAATTLLGIAMVQSARHVRERLRLSEQHRMALQNEIKKRQQAQQFAEDLIHTANVLIIGLDPEGKVRIFNEAAEKLTGYSAPEMAGQNWFEILVPKDKYPQVWVEFLNLKKKPGEQIPSNFENPILAKSGVERIIAWRNNRLYREAQFVGTISFGIDITERKQAEAELQEAQKELQSYSKKLEEQVLERTASLNESLNSLEGVLYHVAHDLRAPLRAMHSFTELLVRNYAPKLDPGGEDYAQRIWASSRKADELIRDLLEYGRLGYQKLALTQVDLGQLCNAILAGLEHEVIRTLAQIQVDQPMPCVLADRKILEQVITNLVSNALKFVPPGAHPQVHLWTEELPVAAPQAEPAPSGLVRLYVEDQGIGIDPEYHQKIFGIFEQLHDAQIYPGTGIGLAIAKKGIQKMGGRVGLESQLGQGARFWLELKRVDRKLLSPALPCPADAPADAPPARM